MRNYLFAALVGCFVVAGLGTAPFEFTDAQGRCWMCIPGAPCSPCPTSNINNNNNNNNLAVVLPPNDPLCPTPDCNLAASRPVLFPMNDPRYYYQCAATGGVWTPVQMECQCGTFFDFEMQRCEFPWDWVPVCSNLPVPIPPPTPCDEVITQPPPDNSTTTTVATTTTPAPCQCIPWIPCWCNPCAMMPCGNCNGCQG